MRISATRHTGGHCTGFHLVSTYCLMKGGSTTANRRSTTKAKNPDCNQRVPLLHKQYRKNETFGETFGGAAFRGNILPGGPSGELFPLGGLDRGSLKSFFNCAAGELSRRL